MGFTRREFVAAAAATAGLGLAACTTTRQPDPGDQGSSSGSTSPSEPTVDLKEFESLAIDPAAWRYDEKNDVYYQLGLTYCLEPATETYESLAIFVPGPYFTGEKKGSTYECVVNEKAVVGSFTPATAPILMPINTGSLAAQPSPTKYGYEGLAAYLDAGCVYVYPGFRGRSSGYDTTSGSDELFPGGSPWPVVDLKAAVRFLRYNAKALPCDASRVFAFGFAMGGGASAVLAASGGSALYDSYLDQIGAITHDAEGNDVDDAIFGSASWCPMTSYDMADAGYEWSCGQYFADGTRAAGTWTALLSTGLSGAYAAYVNDADFRNANDEKCVLDETESGVYAMGSYADEILATLNSAAEAFVSGTVFPYAHTPQRLEDPTFPGDPNLASTRADAAAIAAATASTAPAPDATADADAPAEGEDATADDATATEGEAEAPAETTPVVATSGTMTVQSTIYETAQDYFSALNDDYWWINYSLSGEYVSISSIRDFVIHLRRASQSVSPFDSIGRKSTANQLFGIGEESTLHFDQADADLVRTHLDEYAACADWKPEYETAWEEDLAKVDSLEAPMATRVDMMNPLYYLSGAYKGFGTATVAPHWRINEGLFDDEQPLVTSTNLRLALSHADGVSDVAYTPVWGQGHVLAERSGSPTANLIQWVVQTCTAS